jgi:hypothetical protein
VVCHLWPNDVEPDVNVAHFVNHVLSTGSAPVNKGGALVGRTKAKKRREQRSQAHLIADLLRDRWEDRLLGIDAHGFRMTHRTWAEAAGVQPRAIDRQLGHAVHEDRSSDEYTRFLVGSKTGRRHYVDAASDLFPPLASAEAVRSMLDHALQLEGALFQETVVGRMVGTLSSRRRRNQRKKA